MAPPDFDATGLMPLETPILKVSRPVAACSRCRNAKIKCDGKLPACTSCERNGRAAECTSTNDQFARGKERSYVSTLETRIDKLQAKIEEARARKPSVVSIADDRTTVPSRRESFAPLQPPFSPTEASKAQRRKEATAIDDLVSDFGFLSVHATARDFYGFTSAMSYARLVLSACSKEALPQGTTKALPPRYEATQLIQRYLENIYTLLPIFDEASLYASVDLVYSRDHYRAEPVDHWLVHMVLAIASAGLSQSRGDQHYLEGIGHVCAALERAEDVLHPGSIASVQALVLLTEFAMLDPHHFDSWSLIGAASRAMVDLGLHQDPLKGSAMHKTKLELRRRVFYCIYVLDRSTSLVQTRAFSFSDRSANVKIPFQKSSSASTPASPQPHSVQSPPNWSQSQSHHSALDLIHFRQIQSGWYADIFQSGRTPWDEPYTYLWNACDEMRRWFDNISSATANTMRAFFELDLLYSYVYILSPSPRVPMVAPYAQKLIFEYCIRYADLMLHLIKDPNHTAPVTFYDAMRVYMTGRQFLDVLSRNADELLLGVIPALPEVLPSTAAPPVVPSISIPPGEDPQHFHITRSIKCMKTVTECLALFGMRWGYMSWNQRYQNETSAMLDNLNQRLRDLDAMASMRRPSMWHHGSTSSVSSETRSISLMPSPPPNGQMPQVPVFHDGAVMAPAGATYLDSSPPHAQVSPPPFYHHGMTHQATAMVPPPPVVEQYVPKTETSFNFNDPFAVHQSPPQQQQQNPHHQEHYQMSHMSHLPRQQFAQWSGYQPSAFPDTLDEENAVPPRIDV